MKKTTFSLIALSLVAFIGFSCSDDDSDDKKVEAPSFLRVTGTDADEVFLGTANNDTIVAGDGKDVITAGAGNDLVYGGNGDTFTGSTVLESNGNDNIDGGDGNDQLVAEQGDDVVNGGAGNDLISGSEGNDAVTGGSGNDTFISLLFIEDGAWLSNNLTSGVDIITDFTPGEDALIFFDRKPGFAQVTRQQFLDAFGQTNGFNATVEGGNLILSWGTDKVTLNGSFGATPTTLEELETLLGGSSAIAYAQ